MLAKVDTIHPDYKKACERWCLIRDIVNNTAKKRIYCPSTNDDLRNTQYKENAVLTNFTNLTKTGLTGLVFRKAPEVILPPELEYLKEDCTGSGINLIQFAQKQIGELLQTGRNGLLVDYYNDGNIAYLKPYIAETIINWKTKIVNGRCVLSLVVLIEQQLINKDDLFAQDMEIQYRVLLLNNNNIYEQMVFNKNLQPINRITPVNYNRQPFNYIPFVFIGSENNDWEIDPQPLYDMARLNLQHYRNSADYEESIFICGQPFPVFNVGYMSIDEFNIANPGGVEWGSRKGLIVNAEGGGNLLQANPNQLVAQAMKEKLDQAAAIGARLIEQSGGRETAEAAKIRYGSQHSSLYTIALNESWGITTALKMLCEFMNASPDDVYFELNSQFYEEGADPNLIASQIMLLDRGVISKEEIRNYGRLTGLIDQETTDAEIENRVELINPLEDGVTDVPARRDITTSNTTNETY